MATLIQRQTHHTNLHALATNPKALTAIHDDTEVPPLVLDWLAKLKALQGVPFSYLIADPLLLPVESIRFFQVDPNWMTALVEGAFSIGTATQGDAAHDTVMLAKVPSLAPGELVSGFLLRSEVVKGWANLGVIVYDAAGNVLPNIIEPVHLSDTVLLIMVSGATALDSVAIHEHPEGLHFGVNLPEHPGDKATKSLRYVVAPEGKQAGEEIKTPTQPEVEVPFRDTKLRTVAASQLATSLQDALEKAKAAGPSFTAAEFALEMIEGVQSVNFKSV